MATVIRFLFPLIGFLCTATVITAVGSYFYLRRSGALDDDKLFRVMAVVHDIDINKMEEQHNAEHFDIPPEESSLEERQELAKINMLMYEAKQQDLDRLNSEFKTRFDTLKAAESRNRNFKAEAEKFLTEEKNKAIEAGITAVRNQLSKMNAKKQAKPLLIDMIDDGRIEQVIQLLNGMNSKSRSDILKAFDSDDDLQKLYMLQEKMLAGDPIKPYVEQKLKELNKLQE